MGVSSQSVWRPGAGSGIASFGNGGRLCAPLEADRDQVGPVGLCEVEGMSAVDGCTRSLGSMETPGALEVARIPSVVTSVIVPSVNVPVCVWCRRACTRVCLNACCNARIARVKGVVCEEPRV